MGPLPCLNEIAGRNENGTGPRCLQNVGHIMELTADIVLEDRKLMEWLLEPLRSVR